MIGIENFLHVGRKNAVSRIQLLTSLNVSDRYIRRLIRDARKRGVPIVSTSRRNGYFLAEKEIELIAARLDIRAKIKSLQEDELFFSGMILKMNNQVDLNDYKERSKQCQ